MIDFALNAMHYNNVKFVAGECSNPINKFDNQLKVQNKLQKFIY